MLGDLLDREALQTAMRGCDAVVHLAAAADVDDVARRPAEAEAVNARGTLNVLEAARARGRRARRLREHDLGLRQRHRRWSTRTTPSSCPITSTRRPSSRARCTAAPTRRSTACDCTVLRFGIPYGPRARPAGVIPIFVRKALAGEPLTIAGEGLQSRRFVYVEDLAEGVVRSLAPQAIGRVYNLVGEESVTVRGIADAVRDLVGDVAIVHTPARTADFAGAEVCGARAAAELGWLPATSFDEGVRRYVEWHCRDAATPSAPPAPVALGRLGRAHPAPAARRRPSSSRACCPG